VRALFKRRKHRANLDLQSSERIAEIGSQGKRTRIVQLACEAPQVTVQTRERLPPASRDEGRGCRNETVIENDTDAGVLLKAHIGVHAQSPGHDSGYSPGSAPGAIEKRILRPLPGIAERARNRSYAQRGAPKPA
jgi:hypothetical protein